MQYEMKKNISYDWHQMEMYEQVEEGERSKDMQLRDCMDVYREAAWSDNSEAAWPDTITWRGRIQ